VDIIADEEILVVEPSLVVVTGSVLSVFVPLSSVGSTRVTTSLLFTAPSLKAGLLEMEASWFLGRMTPNVTDNAMTATRKVP
jgi:hypothetical protein